MAKSTFKGKHLLYLYMGYVFLHLVAIPEFAMDEAVSIAFALTVALVSMLVAIVVCSGYVLGSWLSQRQYRSQWTLLGIGFAIAVIKFSIVRSGAFGYGYISAADAIVFWLFFAVAWLPFAPRRRK